MAVKYTLELFPTEGNWDMYMNWLVGKEVSQVNLTPSGVTLSRTNDNAGVDLYCVKHQTVPSGKDATLLDLGVKARMVKHTMDRAMRYEETCHFWLAPRSSIWKSHVRQANSLGVIDQSYRGTLMGAVLTNSEGPAEIEAGTRLFQVLAPDMGYISEVRLLSESVLNTTNRGEGGFGSTGR